MAKRYRPVDRDQAFLLPPDMREWLPAGHPVWLVIGVVDQHLDTSAFHALRRTGGAGAAGYDPDMMVTLLIWAYANGVTSSRRIEALCRTDVAFRVICAGHAPDHVTIARFRAGSGGPVESLFTGVLVLCARLGMAGGVVALDGTKVAASASKAANRTEEGLRKLAAERAAAHAATDAAEDELFGAGQRGDEVPPEAADPARRDERIRRALAELEAEREAARAGRDAQARAYLGKARAGRPRRGGVPAEAQVVAAREKVARAEAAARALVARREQRDAEAVAAGQRGYRGKRPVPPERAVSVRNARTALEKAIVRAAQAEQAAQEKEKEKKGPGPVRNITDPDSRLMPVRGGTFIQGYNAQNVVCEDGLIIATAHTQDTADCGWFGPMIEQAQEAAALITASKPGAGEKDGIGLILADAGYLTIASLTMDGPDRLIATGKHRDLEKAARDDHQTSQDGPIGQMTARLRTPEGLAAYRQRGHIAETPHGHIKHNLRFRQHTMRGLPKTAAEWKFTCTVHNLLKAISTGHLTTAALTT